MPIDRRSVLKGLVAAGGVAVASGASTVAARERKAPPDDAVGMLYDATRCIGCKACVVKCKEANGLPPDAPDGLHDAPVDLNASTKNIIKLYKDADRISYMKAQCMHCVDPACVSVCMFGSLQKGELGIVTYNPDRCLGCRYCQVACPFNVPKFEWSKAVPQIVKCEMCRHLIAKGGQPACCEVCPREAVIYGKLADLKADARDRLAKNPDRYVQKVYGDTDGGGTQVICLSAVPFELLGLPDLGDEPVPKLSETIQHGVYYGFIPPVVLYGALGLVMLRNRKRGGTGEEVKK
ncbi:MAG: hydrogenase 2 operon protein HybA [Acidobacteriota bacterium]